MTKIICPQCNKTRQRGSFRLISGERSEVCDWCRQQERKLERRRLLALERETLKEARLKADEMIRLARRVADEPKPLTVALPKKYKPYRTEKKEIIQERITGELMPLNTTWWGALC